MQTTLSAHERAPIGLPLTSPIAERSLSQRTKAMSAQARGLRVAGLVRWLVLAASFALSASTWMELADLARYPTEIRVLMAFAVDGYVVVALIVWLYAPSPGLASFAKRNTYAAAVYGIAAQSVFHAVSVSGYDSTTYRVVMVAMVSLAPPLFAALTVHMSVQLARDLETARTERALSAEMSAHERIERPSVAHERSWEDVLPLTERATSDIERTTERVSVTERLTERATIARADALPLIARSLSAGGALTGASVADEYGVSEATGRRWLNDARSLAGVTLTDRAERSLTLIRGEGERS